MAAIGQCSKGLVLLNTKGNSSGETLAAVLGVQQEQIVAMNVFSVCQGDRTLHALDNIFHIHKHSEPPLCISLSPGMSMQAMLPNHPIMRQFDSRKLGGFGQSYQLESVWQLSLNCSPMLVQIVHRRECKWQVAPVESQIAQL